MLLGVLRSGAAFLPVDPGFPAQRVGFMLRDARAAVVIASAEAAEGVPALPGVGVLVAGELAGAAGGGAGRPVVGRGSWRM